MRQVGRRAGRVCWRTLMFERFSEQARQVIMLAEEEARSFDRHYVGTEHILLGLLRETEGVASRSLERLGVTIDGVRARVESGEGDSQVWRKLPLTSDSRAVVELAEREALSLLEDCVDTEHILLGILRVGDGAAVQILLDFEPD
ncbi:MAG TPA: Clp protease N-terminal domain-containing protein [Solirubrobacteraceae bacterium]|nr:Clp protease N-terminal domain-containing protein [Solirubrobacteraceae bacterium]